ncbi:uncharacterized protein C8Q71DRAFT_762768 [Rhodofomes roseus]|uniref:DH domain-containing protein n=1 Tax=Rhodofomes roseus TaxID=34475 RepID=A0ABQ8KD99_9APHY|nr:uncharacterized protein C8Q71DRAFT_762768 [Rhodofomes roseus]KAH9835614.1 hypothetical protein C8Q71DRAFT_762768 [Rhodofomes roseus]
MSDDARIPALLNVLAIPKHDSNEDGLPATGVSPSSAYIVDSPSVMRPAPLPSYSPLQKSLDRSASEDDAMTSDPSFSQSARSPSLPTSLPDPSQFPDPYPFRPPRWQHGTSTPALSSAASSSASTRSSAYTSSARSGDFGHVHVVGSEGELSVSGITSDDVVQLLARDAGTSSSMPGRPPFEGSRWSDLYANSIRSRSSSVGNNRTDPPSESGFRALRATPSFDMGWQAVDERDEAGLGSEGETTDDDPLLDEDDEAEEEEPTSAMVIAEEGRGIIVRGDDTPIVKLLVKPGTTHLLIGSSSTPNSVPSFLNNTLPPIANTLLALDISANFLVALPPALAACYNLEELNIASNPIRALPEFLSRLTSLRVLIVDSTGIGTLPESLSALDKLHTLSFRRNKLHALPSWLCLLPSLETLLVDDNPFQGPWKALMEPLLARQPMTPLYPPATPMFSLKSASLASTYTGTEPDETSDMPWHDGDNQLQAGQEDEDTITAARAPHLARSVTEPVPAATDMPSPTLSRTRTTPNRSYYEKNRAVSRSTMASGGSSRPPSSKGRQDEEGAGELRKMKSAGELRRNRSNLASKSASSSPQRGALSEYVTSASSSNLLNAASMPRDSQVVPKRFASLGVASGSTSPNSPRTRITMDNSFWDNTPEEDEVPALPPMPRRATLPSKHPDAPQPEPDSRALADLPSPPPKEEKSRRWGFLKKMSMGKMRPEPSPRLPPSLSRQGTPTMRPALTRAASTNPGSIPQINVRISTTGALLGSNNHALPPIPPEESLPSITQEEDEDDVPPPPPQKPPIDALRIPATLSNSTSSSSLLAATPTPRASKRRSFLPIDMSPIPIPAASNFVNGVTVADGVEDEFEEASRSAQSPASISKDTMEQLQRREEERQREARMRALRSVMAYLRDMQDLSLSQVPLPPIPPDPPSGMRSRRPTIVENGRVTSEGSIPSMTSTPSMLSSRPGSSAGLRSVDSRIGLRSGYTTQTNSVATTDSSGSGEERKYKDNRAKRSRIIREIVETERTYVKGLQELVDIYIAPAAVQVNVLSGVSQKQETLVPAQERKIVFGGLEALYVFHKDSFLPALERVAAPLLIPSEDLVLNDADGYLSLDVATKVAQVFTSHAAFMKMYSTYINNFDNSVQRIRMWTTDKPGGSGEKTLSPSSSSAQLVALGLTTMTAATPGVVGDNVPAPSASLSSGQRKRIKAYLKRCRMNPRHSQLNLEGYLLLPVQRIPRYRLLLDDLVKSSPPMYDYLDNPLERAYEAISSLATGMNEGKRESESRRRLVLWQARIRGKFPSPLVQPHRRLIMDGRLQLTRVVRKATVSFEIIDSHGDSADVQVECLSPELTPRSLVGILCNDLLVLCRDPTDGQDPNAHVDLWAVLRMQTLPQPASIVHGNALRLVDNKAILYFEAPSTSDALTWFRAINLHIPASKA